MRPMHCAHIDPADRAAVIDLIARAADHDGVSPLSEQGLLNLRRETTAGISHLLRWPPRPGTNPDSGTPKSTNSSSVDANADIRPDPRALVGYAQLDARSGADPAAELVVEPAARRQGHGGALLDAVLAEEPQARIWSHGLLPGAAELAASRGLVQIRELLKLGRPLRPQDEATTQLPEGYSVATYDPGDAQDWLQVNAAAFAHHPEQGRMTRADLRDREAEPWFDPAGFFLVRDPAGRLAASHWTKVADDVGEVYVVAVSPEHQGLGLGRAVTAIGLAHLRAAGLARVELYVDGHNAAALATYRGLGFRTLTRDAQFAAGVSR